MSFDRPAALALAPLAVLLLWLLERWRRRAPRVVVADLALFPPDPQVQEEARARRRSAGLRWLLRAAAAASLALAAAGARLSPGPGGPLLLDLVIDRGLSGDVRGADGVARLQRRRAALEQALDRLRPDDRVRLHLLPAGPGPASPALGPATARAVLARTTPVAAAAELAQPLAGLVPVGGPPVLVAADALPPLPPALAARVLLLGTGGPLHDRGITSLRRDEAGTVWVGLLARGAGGPVEVELRATGAEGAEVARRRSTELPSDGQALLGFEQGELPSAPRLLQARLTGPPDDLPLDDVAWAASEARPRRVGLVGDPGPWVRRALRAVPGVVLRELPRLDPADARAAAELDLAVIVRERQPEEPLHGVPVVALPAALPAAPGPGGVLVAVGEGLPHTARRLAQEPATLRASGPLPPLPGARPLLRAGHDGPVVASQAGDGRRLLLTFAFPLTSEATSWVELQSFPLFWAELLAWLAPRGDGQGSLVAHPVGRPWEGPDGPLVPLEVGLVRDREGRPLLGTVAAPPPPATPPGVGLQPAVLDALEASRPAARARPLGPLLLALAAALVCAAWWPESRVMGRQAALHVFK